MMIPSTVLIVVFSQLPSGKAFLCSLGLVPGFNFVEHANFLLHCPNASARHLWYTIICSSANNCSDMDLVLNSYEEITLFFCFTVSLYFKCIFALYHG